MGVRIILPGMVLISSPCPHGCKEQVSVKIPEGERVRNCECTCCRGKVHAFKYDEVVREGHFSK
jgi:hypothetical protein